MKVKNKSFRGTMLPGVMLCIVLIMSLFTFTSCKEESYKSEENKLVKIYSNTLTTLNSSMSSIHQSGDYSEVTKKLIDLKGETDDFIKKFPKQEKIAQYKELSKYLGSLIKIYEVDPTTDELDLEKAKKIWLKFNAVIVELGQLEK
jgi:predicted patatin/cPLA2 family phospholipase